MVPAHPELVDAFRSVTVQTCGDLRVIRPLAERQSSTEFALQIAPVPSNVNSYFAQCHTVAQATKFSRGAGASDCPPGPRPGGPQRGSRKRDCRRAATGTGVKGPASRWLQPGVNVNGRLAFKVCHQTQSRIVRRGKNSATACGKPVRLVALKSATGVASSHLREQPTTASDNIIYIGHQLYRLTQRPCDFPVVV